jgi:hypothetical protein
MRLEGPPYHSALSVLISDPRVGNRSAASPRLVPGGSRFGARIAGRNTRPTNGLTTYGGTF